MNAALMQLRKLLCKRSLIATGLLALFVFVLAMAQSKTLHQSCHADASQPGHQCAVTILDGGQVDVSVIEATILPATAFVVRAQTATSFFPTVDYSVRPSRDPPARPA